MFLKIALVDNACDRVRNKKLNQHLILALYFIVTRSQLLIIYHLKIIYKLEKRIKIKYNNDYKTLYKIYLIRMLFTHRNTNVLRERNNSILIVINIAY